MRFTSILALLFVATALHGANYPEPVERDFAVHDFTFDSGETMKDVRIHYATIGTLRGNNAVLILHGTGGSLRQFVSDGFGGVLFGPGAQLDATRYFIIIPDNIGHGKSSKPSDGLHARFPHYDYKDMVELQRRLVHEELGVKHLKLVMGTSMGGMQTWMWGEREPSGMDALMPLASLPAQIAGRNRMWRKMMIDDIRSDPEWMNGEYKTQPRGLTAALQLLAIAGSAPLFWQTSAPTRDQADEYIAQRMKTFAERYDTNDLLYAIESSRDYDPSGELEKITAPLIAVNFADDFINPPELGIMERLIKRVKNGRYVLIPISETTRGHGSHTIPSLWQQYLAELLAKPGRLP